MAAAAPKSFADDGAYGAASTGISPAGTSGGSAGTANLGNGGIPASWMANGALNGFGGVNAGDYSGGAGAPNGFGGTNITDEQAEQMYGPGALGFDGGGSMPDTGDDQDQDYQPDSNDQGQPDPSSADRLSLALASVDSGLSYGRQQHGLPTGDDDGQQVAGNIPAAPGTQGGGPTPQSGFAPLTPAANPFGKRTAPGTYQPTQSSDASSPDDQSSYQVAGNIPAQPMGPAPTGYPPLAPTATPFGKRTSPGTYQPGESDDSDDEGAA